MKNTISNDIYIGSIETTVIKSIAEITKIFGESPDIYYYTYSENSYDVTERPNNSYKPQL